MSFNAKTDWRPDDDIMESDVNRWEIGIKDAHTAIDSMQPTVANLQTRVTSLEASLANDMRDNQFAFDFSSTTGLSIDAGWVNEQNGWLVIK